METSRLALLYLIFIFDLDRPFSGLIILKPDAFQTIYLKLLSLA